MSLDKIRRLMIDDPQDSHDPNTPPQDYDPDLLTLLQGLTPSGGQIPAIEGRHEQLLDLHRRLVRHRIRIPQWLDDELDQPHEITP